MGDLIIRPSDLKPGKPWKLQLRFHESVGPTEYYDLKLLTEKEAFAIADAGAPFFLFGDPRKVKP